MRGLYLIGYQVLLTLLLLGLPLHSFGVGQDSHYYQSKKRDLISKRAEFGDIPAVVTKIVSASEFRTSVTASQLERHGLEEGSLITIHCNQKLFRTLLLSETDYLSLLDSPEQLTTLSADVLGVLKSDGSPVARLHVLNTGGGIVDWLSLRTGTRLSISH